MRTQAVTLALAAMTLIQAGCAAGFRAGGEHHGVGVGAAIGPANPPVLVAPVGPPAVQEGTTTVLPSGS